MVATEKLRLDLAANLGRGVAMDKDNADLIAQLCARIGMIMEDGSALALGIPSMNEAERASAIAEMSDAASKIAALSAAAAALASD